MRAEQATCQTGDLDFNLVPGRRNPTRIMFLCRAPSFLARGFFLAAFGAVFSFPGCGSERLFSQVGLATLAMLYQWGQYQPEVPMRIRPVMLARISHQADPLLRDSGWLERVRPR